MKRYLILSNDELNQIEVMGTNLDDAIERSSARSMTVLMFFNEYNLADCYIEEIDMNDIEVN